MGQAEFAITLDAYGWPHDFSVEEILVRLLALNLQWVANSTRKPEGND